MLSLDNLFIFHTFMEVFKILKFRSPISLYELLKMGPRGEKFTLLLPRVSLDTSKQNFVFSSSRIWNRFINKVLNKCTPQPNGLVIPGSDVNSDLAASISVAKSKLKSILLTSQKAGDETEWL